MFVLSDLNDSAIIDFDAVSTTKLVALSLCPTKPKIGILVAFCKSDLLEMVSLKKSLNEMKESGINKPNKIRGKPPYFSPHIKHTQFIDFPFSPFSALI